MNCLVIGAKNCGNVASEVGSCLIVKKKINGAFTQSTLLIIDTQPNPLFKKIGIGPLVLGPLRPVGFLAWENLFFYLFY